MGIFDRIPKKREAYKDEAALLKYASELTPQDLDRLISILKNQYSSADGDQGQSMTDYFNILRGVFNSGNLNTIGNNPYTRNQRYEIYDDMDESTAYISSALDILSDDAAQVDENGVLIHIESSSSKVVTMVENLFAQFGIEEKISKWTRATAKYGDFFVKIEGGYGEGINYINDTIYPGIIGRKDMNGKLLAFVDEEYAQTSTANLYAPWEFVHFRHKGDIYREESKDARLGVGKQKLEKNLTSSYGQSVLRPAIKVYAQLRFVENMLLLSRMTNSIRRNIFMVNVGDVAPDKAFETIETYARLLKKNINLNIEDAVYSSQRHTINYDEDIFIPVSDPKNDVRVEQVGGEVNILEQYDLEYLLNKLFSALKIPKAYLNYEQDLNARSTLIQLDIRYARSVGQLQNTMAAGLLRLAKVHLAYMGLDPDEVDLDISLTPVSAIDEEARTEQLQKQVSVARDVWDLVTGMQEKIQADSGEDTAPPPMDINVLSEHIMINYLELDKATVDKILGRKVVENVPLRCSKVYKTSDLHEDYPVKDGLDAYLERIQEAIKE